VTTSTHRFDTAEQAEWFGLGVEWADPGLEVRANASQPTVTVVTDPEQSDADYEVDHRDSSPVTDY